MKNLALLFLLLFAFSACEEEDPYAYDAASYIELKKDPCFGFCPVYEIRIDGKGNATFTGKRNVSKEGDWKMSLTPEETNELFKAFEISNFWTFKDEYTAQVTDLPTTWLTLKLNDKSKTIKDYYGAPEPLKNLEKRVEEIAEQEQGWEKAEVSEEVEM